MNPDDMESMAISIIERVRWTDFADPLGEYTDLAGPLLRMAMDRRSESESRYYCSGIANTISNQGSMGPITVPAVHVLNELLLQRARVDPIVLYEPLEVLTSSQTETKAFDPYIGQEEMLWVSVFREIYGHVRTYVRDFHACDPLKSAPLLDLLCFLSPKFPWILQEFEAFEVRAGGEAADVLRSRIREIGEWIEDDKHDHDDRYDLEVRA